MSVRDALEKAGRSGEDSIRVLVELAPASPSDEVLLRLKNLGLSVERVVGNKVTGRIAAGRLAKLERDVSVRSVERSSKLKLS